jgi:hypothetical protein
MPFCRRWTRLTILVVLLTVEVLCEMPNVYGSGTGSSDASTAVTAPTPVPTLSGCQLCAQDGNCSHAYLDAPGQFCGNWLDELSQRQRCCCPPSATCRVSNYACNCHQTIFDDDSDDDDQHDQAVWTAIATILGAFFFLSGIAMCCWCYCGMGNESDPDPIVYAKPVYRPGPQYGGAPVYYGRQDGMDAGTGALLGGTAGLIGGLLIGEAFMGGGSDGGNFGGDF